MSFCFLCREWIELVGRVGRYQRAEALVGEGLSAAVLLMSWVLFVVVGRSSSNRLFGVSLDLACELRLGVC